MFNAASREQTAEKKSAVVVSPKPVRLSVDIATEPYRQLISFCQDIAFNLGRSRINHVWVLRELIEELFSDPDLKERVIERLNVTKPWER